MSLNQSMSIALDSMKNNQLALTVVSHNIANINTEGYARERVNFVEDRYPTSSKNVITRIKAMNGADISSISNYIDANAFKGMINSGSDAAYYNDVADALSGLEDIADDLGDSGLNALLNDFYTAAANLEQFPADLSIRQQFVMALDNVCDKFNYIDERYSELQNDTYQEVTESVYDINSLLSNLATLNLTHVKNGQGASTQNEINQVLSALSQYSNITYDQNPNGSFNVYYGNVAVVEGTEQKYELTSSFDPEADEPLTISLKALDDSGKTIKINDYFTSGSLKGNVEFLNGTMKTVGYSTVGDMKKAIQTARDDFMTALNEIQTYASGDVYAAYITASGSDLVLASDGGDPNKPLTPPDLLVIDGNGKIQVNPDVMENPFYVAAARIDLSEYEPGEDWTKSIGNADNAGYITALRDAKICSYGGGVKNCTLSQFLINNAAKNGMDLEAMQNKADIYQGIADADKENYTNLIGVNLDEELADMIKYQRAYEASATIFSVINSIMQTIIGMI